MLGMKGGRRWSRVRVRWVKELFDELFWRNMTVSQQKWDEHTFRMRERLIKCS